MVLKVALRFRHRGCVSERFRPGVVLVEVSADRGQDLYVLHAPDAATLAATVRDIERYVGAPVEEVERTPTSLVYRHHNPAGGSVDLIQRSGCTLLWPAIWQEGRESFTVLAPDRAALARLLPNLRAVGEVHVDRLGEAEAEGLGAVVPAADLTGGLTPRQLHVLTRAIAAGYYDAPRRVDTAALAAALQVSPSTLAEHLRKAEAAVLRRLGALLEEQPALRRAARRGPGRPRKR